MLNKTQNGFTLIELMIVIAIIGLLASIAVPQYGHFTKRAKFAHLISATNAVKSAISVCYQARNDFEECDSYADIPVSDPGSSENYSSIAITATTAKIVAYGTIKVNTTTYELTPTYVNTGITWTASGTCVAARLC